MLLNHLQTKGLMIVLDVYRVLPFISSTKKKKFGEDPHHLAVVTATYLSVLNQQVRMRRRVEGNAWATGPSLCSKILIQQDMSPMNMNI
jgi:hypothetical protein